MSDETNVQRSSGGIDGADNDVRGRLHDALKVLAEQTAVPPEFLQAEKWQHLGCFAVPIVAFNASWSVHWTASIGYEQKITGDLPRTDGKTGTFQEKVIDWRPASGNLSGSGADILYAGTAESPNVVIAVENYTEFSRSSNDIQSLGCQITEQHQIDARLQDTIRSRSKQMVQSQVSQHVRTLGDTQKDTNWTGDVETNIESNNLFVPIIKFKSEYMGKATNIAVSGKEKIFVGYDQIPKAKFSLAKWWPWIVFAILIIGMIRVEEWKGNCSFSMHHSDPQSCYSDAQKFRNAFAGFYTFFFFGWGIYSGIHVRRYNKRQLAARMTAVHNRTLS